MSFETTRNDQPAIKNQENFRPRNTPQEHGRFQLHSLREEVDKERQELITSIDNQIIQGEKEGRVIGTVGKSSVVQLILRTHSQPRYYYFTRLPNDTLLAAAAVATVDPERNSVHVVVKLNFLNVKNVQKDEQKILTGIFDANERKIVKNHQINPLTESETFEACDKITPSLKELSKDITKKSR